MSPLHFFWFRCKVLAHVLARWDRRAFRATPATPEPKETQAIRVTPALRVPPVTKAIQDTQLLPAAPAQQAVLAQRGPQAIPATRAQLAQPGAPAPAVAAVALLLWCRSHNADIGVLAGCLFLQSRQLAKGRSHRGRHCLRRILSAAVLVLIESRPRTLKTVVSGRVAPGRRIA